MKSDKVLYDLEHLISFIKHDYTIIGNMEVKIRDAKTTMQGDKHSIVFIAPEKKNKKALLRQTKAGLIVCDPAIDLTGIDIKDKCIVITENPRITFTDIVSRMFEQKQPSGIDKTAVISKNAIIGKGCYIGPNVIIEDVIIGDNCRIYGNCYVHDNTVIGNNVIIWANSVIGSEGFGFLKDSDGNYVNFPHLGGVIINDDVELGSNSSIDRGALADTVIGKGTKIDNQVHIAHNVIIGENCLLTAGVSVSGSVTIGNNVWMSPSCVVLNNVVIGDNAFIGSMSLVIRNVPENTRVFGIPAVKI